VIGVTAAYFYPPGKIQLHRRRAEAETSLRAIETLRTELGKIPPLKGGDTVFVAAGISRAIGPENAAFVQAEDLTDLSADTGAPLRFCESRLNRVAYLVRNGRWTPDEKLNLFLDTPGFIDENIDYVKGLRYLFVIRRETFAAPKLGKTGGFESGAYSGDLILFEIPTRKLLAHHSVYGSNGNWIESHEAPEQAILTDLGAKVRRSIDETVSGVFPAFADSARVNGPCSLY
jgi:hypothetical protein